VTIKEHSADAGFGCDIVEAGGGEAGPGKGAGGRGENLVAPVRARKASNCPDGLVVGRASS
jgi:hypothetical protein